MYLLTQTIRNGELDFHNTRVLCASKDLGEMADTFHLWFDKWKRHPEYNPVMIDSMCYEGEKDLAFTARIGETSFLFQVKETTTCYDFDETGSVEEYDDNEDSLYIDSCRDCLNRRACQHLN